MNEQLKKKFLKLKIKLIEKKKTSKITIVTNRNRIDPVLRVLWCASIYNKYKNHEIVLLTSKRLDFSNKIFFNFGVKNIIYTDLKKTLFDIFSFRSFLYAIRSLISYLYYSFKGIDEFIYNFNVNEIKIGQNIHDSFIKKNHCFPQTYLLLPLSYLKYIYLAYFLINKIETFIINNNVKNIILNKSQYFAIDSILFLIGKKYKIRTVMLNEEKILLSKKFTFHELFYTVKKQDLKKKINKKLIDKFIYKHFKGMTDRDIKNSHSNKIELNKIKFEKFFEKKAKKTVLFCPHAFSDSFGAGGEFLFRDFYDFFEKSIIQMGKIQHINWIVKLHPSRFLYREEGVGEKLIKKYNFKNIYVLPDHYLTTSIVKLVDAVVSGTGTIIPEALMFGKKTLAYKNNRFKNLNIYIKYYNKLDYFKKLSFKNINLNVSYSEKILAKKILYILYKKVFSSKDKLLIELRNKNKTELKKANLELLKKLNHKGEKIVFNSYYYKKLMKTLL